MPLFDNETPEVVRDRILSRMSSELDTREGSFAFDVVAPVAFELWRQKMTMEELLSAFYIDETSGKYLDPHANLVGLARKEGAPAAAVMSFAGRDGLVIPAGTVFFSDTGKEFMLEKDATIQDGVAVGRVVAAQVGEAYNVDAGSINQMLRNLSGLNEYTNEAAAGGADPERDTALFGRIDQKRKNPATSSNEAHYREWALEVDGIGDCRVDRLWAGNGTVRVVVVGYGYDPVDETVVAAVAENIEAKRAVGAHVTVISAGGASIDVAATLVVDPSSTLAAVKATFSELLTAYLQESIAQVFKLNDRDVRCTIYYNRIAALLMSVDGVIDYADLTVNGGTDNITLDDVSVPVVGEVTLV